MMLSDSAEGMELMLDTARVSGLVLYPFHRELAQKYGLSTDGVIFAELLPLHPERGDED
jgi:hypothetical protein